MAIETELANFAIQQVIGYPSLASFIATRNILYLQSELAELEARQDAYDKEDVKGSMTDKKSRMKLVKEIQETMKEYREAIFFEINLLALDGPPPRTLTAFRNEFNNVKASGPKRGYPTLRGRSRKVYDDPDDLIVLAPQQEEDRLTKFLRQYFAILFTTQRTDSPLTYFSETRLRVAVAIINMVIAAALLFGAILNLYWVTNNDKRLGLIAGYTVAFATCVGLLTNAKRSEVFTSCAAYAAVFGVFVSGNLGALS
ncbi:uncharacterized protein PAC_05777 [Phialocephala subalpina]|uniref:DUF6594 domain-containing protein n=1 Tax=Phialocephala subalpina TaxID=576137 RepID=A0A1L7WSZ4_9HELO|nr:uncharacterized protein PAC_05777 [Phialocephala subalpina]